MIAISADSSAITLIAILDSYRVSGLHQELERAWPVTDAEAVGPNDSWWAGSTLSEMASMVMVRTSQMSLLQLVSRIYETCHLVCIMCMHMYHSIGV